MRVMLSLLLRAAASGRPRTLALAATLASLGAAGCAEEVSGFLSCGSKVCNAREECVDSADEPFCRCQEGYAGDNCEACASGYRASPQGGCEPIPIDCDTDPGICGAHGVCVEAAGQEDSCRCDERWTGRLCELCAAGYQDNDFNESCEPDCATAGLVCESPRVCDESTGTATCVCPVGFVGDDCRRCALGYRDNGDTCTPTCAQLDLQCRTHEVCVDSGTTAHCECAPGYAGATCARCAEGYSDELLSGECLPTCDALTLSCGNHGQCADDIGFAYCECEAGWAGFDCTECADGHLGDDCELCEDGYYRVGDGACQARCDTPQGCPPGERCLVSPAAVSCSCPIGYSGTACNGCADDFASDATGNCVAVVNSANTLLSAALDGGTPALVAINPATGATTLLRSITVGGLAHDASSDELYASTEALLGSLDLATGAIAQITDQLAGPPAVPLAWDTQAGELLALAPTSGRPLVRVDLATGATTEIGPTNLTDAFDLAYDATSNRALVAADALYAVDLSTGVVSTVGPLPTNTRGIASTPGGILYAVTAPNLSPDQARIETCRRSAAALGLTGYEDAPGAAVVPTAAESEAELVSLQSAAAEVVAYEGPGDFPGERIVRVNTTNRDTVVCLAVAAEQTRVVVSATTELTALVVLSSNATITLELDDAFSPAQAPAVHAAGDGALWGGALLDDARARLYSAEEWADRRVPLTPAPEVAGPGEVHELDPTDASSLSVVTLRADVIPTSPASTWQP